MKIPRIPRDQSDNQNVNFINYNEQYIFEYGSSDDKYIAMIEQNKPNTIESQNMKQTFGNTDCNLLLDSASRGTIINRTLAKQKMFNVLQA